MFYWQKMSESDIYGEIEALNNPEKQIELTIAMRKLMVLDEVNNKLDQIFHEFQSHNMNSLRS